MERKKGKNEKFEIKIGRNKIVIKKKKYNCHGLKLKKKKTQCCQKRKKEQKKQKRKKKIRTKGTVTKLNLTHYLEQKV